MSSFDKSSQLPHFAQNITNFLKGIFSQPKKNPASLNTNSVEQALKTVEQNRLNTNQAPVNIASNTPNQASLTNPTLNQSALNLLNQAQKSNSALQNQESNAAYKPSEANDLPAHTLIQNISLKTWISEHDSKGYANLESGEKQLAATLQGIKGFQKKNQEDTESRSRKNKYFSILHYMFFSDEQAPTQDIELMANLLNFNKLATGYNESESQGESKLTPPLPSDTFKLTTINTSQIKYLHELLALPREFPECLRIFTRGAVKINEHSLRTFLVQRLKIAYEQTFGLSNPLSKTIADFTPLLNQNNFPLLLPLVLLYYPLPLPFLRVDNDFLDKWKNKKKEEEKDLVIASCNIYFLSKSRGRFLLKFELTKAHELNFDIQTSNENKDVVTLLETAIAECMLLLENPPFLSTLNALLADEISSAIDSNEELSIVSSGPIRIEIVLVVYASLIILNKLNEVTN